MPQGFSPIQNHILSRLKNAKSLRYSELQPDGVPNDLFNYHLQFLVKKGFVNRAGDGYSLAEAGIKHIADPDISTEEEKIASLFKANVITLVSRVRDGKIEILNQVRKSHPSFGKIGAMGGIVRKGESLEDAASRKLAAETGLVARFKVVGIERRMMYVANELFSDIIYGFLNKLQTSDYVDRMYAILLKGKLIPFIGKSIDIQAKSTCLLNQVNLFEHKNMINTNFELNNNSNINLIKEKESKKVASKIQYEQLMSSSFSIRYNDLSYKRKFDSESQVSNNNNNNNGQPTKSFQPKKLLIVDNATSNVKILHRLLEMRGHYCEVAVNGLIAVHMVNATLDMNTNDLYLRNYDAILMNLIMPVMDGCEATKEIRKLGYIGPIIGMTAGILHEDNDIFMDAGTTLVLPKPLDLHELHEVINNFPPHVTK